MKLITLSVDYVNDEIKKLKNNYTWVDHTGQPSSLFGYLLLDSLKAAGVVTEHEVKVTGSASQEGVHEITIKPATWKTVVEVSRRFSMVTTADEMKKLYSKYHKHNLIQYFSGMEGPMNEKIYKTIIDMSYKPSQE